MGVKRWTSETFERELRTYYADIRSYAAHLKNLEDPISMAKHLDSFTTMRSLLKEIADEKRISAAKFQETENGELIEEQKPAAKVQETNMQVAPEKQGSSEEREGVAEALLALRSTSPPQEVLNKRVRFKLEEPAVKVTQDTLPEVSPNALGIETKYRLATIAFANLRRQIIAASGGKIDNAKFYLMLNRFKIDAATFIALTFLNKNQDIARYFLEKRYTKFESFDSGMLQMHQLIGDIVLRDKIIKSSKKVGLFTTPDDSILVVVKNDKQAVAYSTFELKAFRASLMEENNWSEEQFNSQLKVFDKVITSYAWRLKHLQRHNAEIPDALIGLDKFLSLCAKLVDSVNARNQLDSYIIIRELLQKYNFDFI